MFVNTTVYIHVSLPDEFHIYNIVSWYIIMTCTHEEHETYISYVLYVQERHSERLFC